MTEPHVPKQHFEYERLGEAILEGSASKIQEALEEGHLEERMENLARVLGRLISKMAEDGKAEEVAKLLAGDCGYW